MNQVTLYIIASQAKEGKYTHVVTVNSISSRAAVIRAAALNGHHPISDVTSIESEQGEGPNVSSYIEM